MKIIKKMKIINSENDERRKKSNENVMMKMKWYEKNNENNVMNNMNENNDSNEIWRKWRRMIMWIMKIMK